MEGFDAASIFYSDNLSNLGTNDGQSVRSHRTDLRAHKNKFKEFLRSFVNGFFNYKYRNILKHNYNIGHFYLDVNLEDLSAFDEELCQAFYREPDEYLPVFEEAATEVADEVTSPRPADEEELQHIQIMLNSAAEPTSLRDLDSTMVSKIVKLPGIITSTSGIKLKASSITIQCRSCGHVVPKIHVKPGLEGYHLPRKCASEQSGQTKCPLDPYLIRTDNCPSWDFQVLKLQELPESIPRGEMPRFLQLYSDRFLCDQVAPGNRVYVVGIYSIKRAKATKKGGGPKDKNVGVRTPYVRVIGIRVQTGAQTNSHANLLPENDEELFRKLAASPNVYERIAKSIAPSIFGMDDVKKAIACLLFGGSRKKLPDGLTRRGDINLLLLGDPGMAKSQLLKFVEKVSPIGVYTSGKGSSAAGLTASVIRDPHTRNFVMEGGAMVLADGGIVCIDEFDKMREDDRVSIHEAMEQQTISVAKAGITTTINSRCSVFAAANSIFGRWDDLKGSENINFMPTILSRFDMIFIVKDTHSLERDVTIAKHVMNVHMKAGETTAEQNDGELSLNLLKKYINFCRTRCGPRLSEAAGEKLKTKYVLIRSEAHRHDMENRSSLNIPITVRQLEAVGRIAESLAKMELQPFVSEAHVDEALRLFQVSTLDAAISGSLAGSDELTSNVDYDKIVRIEKLLKKRMPVGVQVSEQTVVSDFVKQKYPECAIRRVIQIMLTRGELVHRAQRKMLYRIC